MFNEDKPYTLSIIFAVATLPGLHVCCRWRKVVKQHRFESHLVHLDCCSSSGQEANFTLKRRICGSVYRSEKPRRYTVKRNPRAARRSPEDCTSVATTSAAATRQTLANVYVCWVNLGLSQVINWVASPGDDRGRSGGEGKANTTSVEWLKWINTF